MEGQQAGGFFYVQLARSYRKIIESSVFDPRYTLLHNTVDRNKKEIVKGIIAQKEWDEAVELFASLAYRKPFNFDSIQRELYRGYRYYFMKRNVITTYMFWCLNITLETCLLLWAGLQDWNGSGKSVFSVIVIFVMVSLIRYEHRLSGLKMRIAARLKDLRSGSA